MQPETLHLLLIEDSADDAALVRQTLHQAGLTLMVRQADSAASMAAALRERSWDLVISDYNLPGFSGTDALQLLRDRSPDTPFIVVSGCIGEEAAVALMKEGADDYVMKDNLARLPPAVERSLKDAQARAQGKFAELALRESEARFKAIAANLPGTVLQLQLDANGKRSFGYVSEGCQALCGVNSQLLQRQPDLFFGLIDPGDADAFMQSMQISARDLAGWNWEGRIHVRGSDEIKWVNLRSSPRRLGNGAVLWEGILSDVTQNKLAEIELRHSREQLSSLSAHIQSVKEQERTSIAREIHDDLGGTLTAIKIELMRLGKDLAPGARQAQQHLRSTEALVDSALDTTRRISTELRPGILDLGIVAAIQWQGAEFQKRMDMPCLVSCAQDEIPLADEASIALFRIFQETLTNVAKHAGATRVEVELAVAGDEVILAVTDNGQGIADTDLSKPNAFGIRGMRERAYNLGGEASVSRSSAGTQLRVSVPLSAKAARTKPADDEKPGLFAMASQSSPRAAARGAKRETRSMGKK